MKPNFRIVPLLSSVSLLLVAVLWLWPQSSRPPKGAAGKTNEQAMVAAAEVSVPPNPAMAEPAAEAVIPPAQEALAIPELAALSEWQARWANAEPARRADLLEEGLRLATARKPVMAELMRGRPDAALQAALTWSQWAALPEEVRALTERPFSLTGDYDVHSDCRPAEERNQKPRHLTWLGTVDGSLKVHPASGWKDVTSKSGLPVQGIRLEDEVVLRSGVFQVLDAADAAAVAGLLPARKGDAGLPVTALVGGERATFPNADSVNVIAGELTAALRLNGPHTVDAGLAIAFSSSSGQAGSIIGGASAASLAWSATPKRVLALRLDFADAIGAIYTKETLEARLAAASARLESMSYGVTRLSTMTATSQVLRLPRTRAQYAALPGTAGPLADDALAAAAAAGYILADYDIFIFSAIPTGNMGGAFATIGGFQQWVTGQYDYGTFLHELGHNYGLKHANAWVGNQAGGDWTERNGFVTQYGPAANDEYNDVFDAMGSQSRTAPGSTWVADFGDFSMDSKVCLGWMQPAAVSDATASGIYRIHRFDHEDAADDVNRKLALSFRTADGQRIWAGLRRNYVNNPLLGTSAYLVWANSVNGHRQIDCTPFSRINAIPGNNYDVGDLDREDGGLPTGVTWTAPDGSVRLTNLGFGGVAPNEYLDLQVELLPEAAAYNLFTTAALTTPGLTGSYFNSGLRAVNEPDWTSSQVRTGTRIDAPPHFPSAGWGSRAAVGITGGTDADWNNFSVQWDGYVRINRTTRLATKSDDGSRMWIDTNANDAFEAGELLNNGWGTGQGATVGQYSAALPAGNYKVRIQYEEATGGNSFQLVNQGEGDFEIYQDEQLQTYGLNASFVNASLRNVAVQDDWKTNQTLSGSRADPIPLYLDNGMGVRDTVGITGGSDGDWRNFSVQYDGYLKVLRRTRFINYGAGGARFWIDTNDDGNFGAAAPEYTASNWGQNGNARFGGFSGWVEPGDYRVRVQHAVEQDGNRFGLMGQNDRQVHDGRGLSLNGNGWVSAPAGAAVSGNFTVEAWVRPSQTNGTLTLFSTRNEANDFGFTCKIRNGNEVIAHIGTANSWLSVSSNAGQTYRANEWMHVAYAVSGAGYSIYLNGWKAGSGVFNGVPVLFDANHPPVIGRDSRWPNEGFRGQMDEVRVWNTTRTGEQIASNYRRPVAANAPGLVSCWRFDDAAGAVPSDLVNARNGALNGDAALTDLETLVTPTPALIVNSLASSGAGSLQEALVVAAGLPGPVTINMTITDTATALQAYARNLNGGAANALLFAKTSGPEWLAVAANGNLSGTPDAVNAGANAFTLSVTDAAGTTVAVTLNINAAAADLTADLDSDGFTNGLEITLGTDPKLTASQPPAIYANLRAWWKFDESSGTVADDSTGRPQDGTVTGAAWTAGIAGNALSFTGTTQGVLMTTAPSIVGSGDFTVSAWVKVEPGSTGGTVIQQREPGASGYLGQYALNVNAGGTVNFYVYGNSTHQFNLTTTDRIDDGRWHLIAATRQGVNGRILIDGISAANGSGNATLMPLVAHAVSVGYDNRDLLQRRFNGLIDEVKIHERVLSAAELKTTRDLLVPNGAPVFTAGSLVANATEDVAFVGQLAATDPDYGDTRTYEKVGAAGWLQVAANGVLSGTPDNSHVGLNNFTVRVRDAGGLTVDATLVVTVTNVNDAPLKDDVALADFQLAKRDAISGEAYAGNFAGIASDPDGDSLNFTKTSGPGWLDVEASGALSGTPAVSDEVANTTVVIRATDPGGLWVEANFQLTVIVRRSLAVNYSDSATASTAVLATENTSALNTAASISGPVVWNNQAIDDAGNGVLSNGRGTGSYSGVTVNSFSSVPNRRGSSTLSGSDASQRVFRYYLGDGGTGGSYSSGDSVGASIHLVGLQQFLTSNRAASYTLTLLYNADSTSASPFHTATIRSGVPAAASATAISNLPSLGTITPTLLGNGKQPLPSVGTDTGGQRGWGRLNSLTADSITISLPVVSGSKRGSIAGFILTPVPVNGALPMQLAQPPPQADYAQWVANHFGEAASDPKTAGETADPNGDGVANLLAYAMGIDPLVPPAPGATPAQRGRIELMKANGSFHFDFQRDLSVSDVGLTLEDSSSLGAASDWAPADVVEEILSEEGDIRTVRATYTPPLGTTHRFFRLRASR